jgi:hypothetical protein
MTTRPTTDQVAPFCADRSFPYVLACSTLGTIVSLAAVWTMTAASLAPLVGA